jgi:hypothetical protein
MNYSFGRLYVPERKLNGNVFVCFSVSAFTILHLVKVAFIGGGGGVMKRTEHEK